MIQLRNIERLYKTGAGAAIEKALADLGLARPKAPLLAVAPGAEYGPAKRWPSRHFAALAAARRAQGWEVWLFGSAGDREAAATIPATVDLVGRTGLDQAVALLSLADAVVSNDSGLDQKMTRAFHGVYQMYLKEKVNMRQAAYLVSVARVAEACKLRGWV